MPYYIILKLTVFQWSEKNKQGQHVGFKGSMKIKSGAGERLILNHFSKL